MRNTMPGAYAAVPATFAGMAVTLPESPITFDRNTHQAVRMPCGSVRAPISCSVACGRSIPAIWKSGLLLSHSLCTFLALAKPDDAGLLQCLEIRWTSSLANHGYGGLGKRLAEPCGRHPRQG